MYKHKCLKMDRIYEFKSIQTELYSCICTKQRALFISRGEFSVYSVMMKPYEIGLGILNDIRHFSPVCR